MKLLRNIKHLPDFINGTVVAPGNFDGVHLGHQALLLELKKHATQRNMPLIVLLFEPQPAEFFHQEKAPARLSSLREKINFLAQCEVDYVCCLKFDKKLAETRAEDFAKIYLFAGLKAKLLLVGKDFRFGHQRLGDYSLLKQLAQAYQCTVTTFDDFTHQEQRVSSTKIRKALTQGDFLQTEALLGRPYSLCGRVTRGDGRGRQWGIPTANILLHRKSLPLLGVFCVKVQFNDTIVNGVANIGNRPTVDGTKIVLEIHLLDFDQSLYGSLLHVFFLRKLRDEVKFTSIDNLIAQIQMDIQQTTDFFNLSTYDHG